MSLISDILDPGGLLEDSENISGLNDPILSAERSLQGAEAGGVEGFFADPSGLGTGTTGSNERLLESEGFLRVRDPLDLSGGQATRAADEAARQQEEAATGAISEERRARARGQEFLEPFGGIGLRGVEESAFLADPQAQFEFLQNNPLFNLALEKANRQTQQSAASRGRLSAGDTLSALSNNVLLSAQPLIDRQRQDIGSLLNVGTGIAQTQANVAIGEGSNVAGFLQDIGNIQSSATIAGQQARQQGAERAGSLALSAFSDSRLKFGAHIIGNKNGYDIYSWTWNNAAKKLFDLIGDATGVMFNDVLSKNPEAVDYQDGYGKVNYNMIGVENGS